MKRVVCPGSFDPITHGHLDIIGRASEIYDEVVIAVLVNREKSSLFTVDERIAMINETVKGLKNVTVDSWSGLLVDYCRANQNYSAIVREPAVNFRQQLYLLGHEITNELNVRF